MSAPPLELKVAKLLRLLGSDRPGEVVAAAAAIGRALKSNGCDWHDLARACEGVSSEAPLRVVRPAPMSFWDTARYCRDHDRGRLSDTVRQFVGDMARRGFNWSPTPKQLSWLETIFGRLQTEVA